MKLGLFKFIVVSGLFFLCSPACFAQESKISAEIVSPEPRLTIGEELSFTIEWLGIKVAYMSISVPEITTINGFDCYHVIAKLTPREFFRKWYDLEYTVHSYIDVKGLFSRRFEKVRLFNNEINHVIIDFDHDKLLAKFTVSGSGKSVPFSPKRKKMENLTPITNTIEPFTQDMLSCFYYFRLIPIKANGRYPITIYYDQRNFPTIMAVDTPFIRERRKKGAFGVVKVFPDSDISDYIFGKRKFSFYLGIDSARIPVEFYLPTALGTVRGYVETIKH